MIGILKHREEVPAESAHRREQRIALLGMRVFGVGARGFDSIAYSFDLARRSNICPVLGCRADVVERYRNTSGQR